ncbi:MAG: Flp pilus assembly protein CpaB [Pseudomonadota bacterium]
MKRAQLVVVGLAIVAGLGAFMLSGGKPKTVIVEKQVPTESKGPPVDEILVVTKPVDIGGLLTDKNLAWKPWPRDSVGKFYITKAASPKAMEEYKGAVSRYPLIAGDPVNTARVYKDKEGGVMSALLPQGMRGIALPISPETGVGGFVLPNDRVDILLTRKQRNATGSDNSVSETILSSIRVMAIDQTIQEKDGEKVVVGRTATLEISPRDAETLAMAKQMGEISLALRSLSDSKKKDDGADASGVKKDEPPGSITVVRSGIQSQVPVSR